MTPLRQRMSEALELSDVSPKTLKLYVDCVARFVLHFGLSPEQLGTETEEVRTYLLYLVREQKVS
jgi:integrase/recombinase XerD